MLMWSRRALLGGGASLAVLGGSRASADEAAADDARRLIDLVFERYAYRERLAGFSEARLRSMRDGADAVSNEDQLIDFGERALAALFDHHAILGSSFSDSYAIVPSFADLWFEADGVNFVVEDVRQGSPALAAGVRPGDRLIEIAGVRTSRAIENYIAAPLTQLSDEQRASCVRVLAAGRRDQRRRLVFARETRRVTIEADNLYQVETPARERVSVNAVAEGVSSIRINDSLGSSDTVAAFASAMAQVGASDKLIVDLRDTPSGGNTLVARGILGWFVESPTPYQRHELSVERFESGVRRSWIEEVSPFGGAPFRGRVVVLVSRWTGSMGEGLALGFDGIGATVIGSRMAGLLGAIYDYTLPNTGVVVKLPSERLFHVDGRPRETFVPRIHIPQAEPKTDQDLPLREAVRILAAS